jgi:tight adherence protein B
VLGIPPIAFAVFAAVIMAVLIPYYLLVVRDEQRVLDRLSPRKSASGAKRLKMLKPEEAMSSVGGLNSVLQNAGFAGRIRLLLEQSAVKMNVGVFLLASGCSALVMFLFVSTLTRSALTGLGFSFLGLFIPYAYVKRARRKRVDKFEEQFPEAIDLVARALRAGHALPTGLGMVADELKAPVGTEFRILYDEQNFGLTLPDAMKNFARRIPVLDARFFVTAVLTQRETGGNLAEVLDNLAAVIRERFKIKRQVRVLTAHGRITGWVLACLPPVLAMATLVINPAHLGTLTGDPLGRQMLIAAVVLQVLGTLAIRKLVQIEY